MVTEMAQKTDLEHVEVSEKSKQGLNALNVRLNKRISALEASVTALTGQNDSLADQITDKASTIDTESIHNKKFKMGPWLPRCEDGKCDTKNPKWKDETECKDCKYPLGAVETLPEIDSCPGCSKKGTEFSAVRKNEEE